MKSVIHLSSGLNGIASPDYPEDFGQLGDSTIPAVPYKMCIHRQLSARQGSKTRVNNVTPAPKLIPPKECRSLARSGLKYIKFKGGRQDHYGEMPSSFYP
ncbi:hypothetical protein AVEN_141003-1 [Araneus ventricosus]|uniref:Uncharacterized protein n=1 Tax=Araneus ventricosus TaxID=182803 RepID=A0A4Y2L4L1_ARAVE|nr:hypothetical protein AVEN_141003-1 [Araneus ventricosus]